MSDEIEAIKETAKATQEVAKATGKALETAEKVGSFFSKLTGGTLEQGIGIWEDKLKYKRLENQIILVQKYQEKLKELGIIHPLKKIPLKLAIPLIDAASLEDDGYLQELWTNLIVNSVNNNNPYTLERSHRNIQPSRSN